MDPVIIRRIAEDTAIPESSVAATVTLFEKGATGPFVAHYRKEAAGGLDAVRIRSIQERIAHYREVWDQRAALLKLLSNQGKLTDELRAKVESCFTKVELDDLHHQFRPRKKTRAADAIEKGLEPLAEYFWNQETDAWSVEEHIDVFVDPSKGISTREEALQGVVDIIAEWIWEKVECRKALRELLWNEGFVVSTVVPAKVGQKTKYNMYYERRESVTTIPSHRVLAIRRGCKEGILVSSIEGDNAKALECLLALIMKEKESIFGPVLEAAARESHSRILRPLIETEVRIQLKERADREAIKVFQENLANLLLSPPAGPTVVMGIDWGKSDDCSVAVVDETGGFLEGARIRLIPAPVAPPHKASQELKMPPPASEVRAQETGPVPQELELLQAGPPTEPVLPPADEAEIPAADSSAEMPQSETASAVPSEESDSVPGMEPAPGEIHDAAMAGPAAECLIELPAESEMPGSGPATDTPQISAVLEVPAVSTETADVLPDGNVDTPEVQDAAPAEPLPVEEGAVISEAPQAEPLTVVDAAQPGPEPPIGESSPKDQVQEGRRILRELMTKYHVRAIAIGTGTGARELEGALRQIVSGEGLSNILIAAVNDAGIAIYASSRIAREEFPDWSASARCAVSLARRLQDPLAELVKIDPKLIGVGQYQHDVDQKELHRSLLQTLQYCVNKVGVNVNTAGESLLRYVSGLNEKLARRIVAVRKSHGPFPSRASLIPSTGLDESAYQQSAAFLRIPEGENVLDRTAIHPESYWIVERMASTLNVGVRDLIGNRELVSSLKLEEFVGESAGMTTLRDIREELLRPGRDPRKSFRVPKFRADVKEMSDLKPGMALEGTVTNVTNFGAFVDIGVRQDGLVHLSQMSNRFIRDPREAVKVGDVVQVKVISVEPETKRIGLSMKALLPPAQRRRKKQQRPNISAPVPRPESASAEMAADAGASSQSTVSARVDAAGPRPRPEGFRERPHRPRRRGPRRPPPTDEAQQKKEPATEVPEPTLQEKIAILQSRFRGIS